jgi:hypothetical protein
MPLTATLLAVCVVLSTRQIAVGNLILNPDPGTGNYSLVTNGDFSTGIDGWTRIESEPYGTMSWSSSEGFTNFGSITSNPTVPRPGPGFAYHRQLSGLIPNQTYVLSGAFKVDDINAGSLYIDMTDSYDGTDTGFTLSVVPKPIGWFFAYNTFKPAATSATVRIIRDTYGSDLLTGGFVDNIAVTPLESFVAPIPAVPEPSTYCTALAGLACGGYSMFRRRKRA